MVRFLEVAPSQQGRSVRGQPERLLITMTKGFIKLLRGSDLMQTDPNAYLILNMVALFMGRDGSPARITARHFPSMTENQYREAKKRLQTNHRLATFKPQTRFTEGWLTTRDVFDINESTTDKPQTNHDETTTKQEVRSKKKEKDNRGQAPNAQAVFEYMATKTDNAKARREAPRFFDYWESCAWKRRGGPVKDWKASARYWLSNDYGGNDAKAKSREDIRRELFDSGSGVVINHDDLVPEFQTGQPAKPAGHLGGPSTGILARGNQASGGQDD